MFSFECPAFARAFGAFQLRGRFVATVRSKTLLQSHCCFESPAAACSSGHCALENTAPGPLLLRKHCCCMLQSHCCFESTAAACARATVASKALLLHAPEPLLLRKHGCCMLQSHCCCIAARVQVCTCVCVHVCTCARVQLGAARTVLLVAHELRQCYWLLHAPDPLLLRKHCCCIAARVHVCNLAQLEQCYWLHTSSNSAIGATWHSSQSAFCCAGATWCNSDSASFCTGATWCNSNSTICCTEATWRSSALCTLLFSALCSLLLSAGWHLTAAALGDSKRKLEQCF